jgi:transcriptional regulator with XRE-family HTH domain
MAGEGRESFASQVAALRSRAGLSLAQVGAAAHVVRGYVHHIEHGLRWPSRSVAAALDSSLSAEGTLLAAWEAADITKQPDRTIVAAPAEVSPQPADKETVLVSAADESARFLAWAEASNIGDLTLEQMHSDIRWIACNYLKVPTLPLFTRVCAIRDRAFGLLAGRQRPPRVATSTRRRAGH